MSKKKKQTNEMIKNTANTARAADLANNMLRRGLLVNDDVAIKEQIAEMEKWNDDAFASMERVVNTITTVGELNKNVFISVPETYLPEIEDMLNDKDVGDALGKLCVMPQEKPQTKIKKTSEKKMTPTQRLKTELEEKQKVIDAHKIHITNLKDQKDKQEKELNAQISELRSDQLALVKDANGYVNLIKLAIAGFETLGKKTEATVKKDENSISVMQGEIEQQLMRKRF
jgi:Fe-S-cluster formation regulator IscX/YfhJ